MNDYQNITNSQEVIIKHYLPDKTKIMNLSNWYSAFGDSTRLKIIISLCIMPMCVGDLSLILNINQTTLSHQLHLLKINNIVCCERNKKTITYSICDEYVEKLIECGVDCINNRINN